MKIINSQNKITNALIVGTNNYKNMTIFTAGCWSVPTYISLGFIYVDCTATLPSYASWNFREGFL